MTKLGGKKTSRISDDGCHFCSTTKRRFSSLLRLPFSMSHESVSRDSTDARRFGATLVLK